MEGTQLDTILDKAYQLLRAGQHEHALNILEPLAKQALAFYHEEMHVEMARFYYALGTTILAKIENSNEIFGGDLKAKVDHQGEKDKVLEEAEEKQEEIGDMVEEKNTMEEKKGEEEGSESESGEGEGEEVEDIQAAWENLEVARQIYRRESEVPDCSSETLHQLARVHMRLGDLEMWRENYSQSSTEYQESLQIRQKYQDPSLSRDIAEIYFTLSNLAQYKGDSSAEQTALEYLRHSQDILHKNLLVHCPQLNLTPRLDLQPSTQDSDEVTELKSIIQDLYQKMDDLELVIQQKFLLAQATAEQSLPKTGFGQPSTQTGEKKIINLGVLGNARKNQKSKESEESENKP